MDNALQHIENQQSDALFEELCRLIGQSRQNLVSLANQAFFSVFWQVGRRIKKHVMGNKRAGYGNQIVVTLSRQLMEKHGGNFFGPELMSFRSLYTIKQNNIFE